MAIAKKCDVCGKLYEEYNVKEDPDNVNGLMFLNLDNHNRYLSHKAIDLCPKCMESIKNWIDALRKNGEERENNDI